MNLNHFYHYYKSKSGGVSNLLKASEDFTSSLDWLKKPDTDAPTITGGVTDPNGGTDAQRVNFTANRQSRVQQSVTLSASTQYTFSVYARVNTGTDQFRLRNITLSAAQPSTATTSWTRFEYTFTTTTGGVYELSIQNTENAAANIEFFGAMLNVGSSANAYVKVDPSTGGSAPTPAYSGFGDVFGGATAYYSLRKFTEAETLNAIRVRRSSDDTEQDIGFDANGDLDTTALTAFVNASGNAYTSDFTSGNEDLLETGGTGADGQSIADVSDAYKFTQDGSTGIHRAANPTNTNIVGGNISISFDYYLPSGQTSNRILFRTNDAGDAQVDLTTTDAWTTYSTTFSGIAGDSFLFYSAIIGQGLSFTGNGSDHFYLKNIVVTQTDADGAVTTWYDQSGNGNDATNINDSEQPLVVSGGTLVTENGKAAVEFSGNPVYLDASSAISDAFTGNSAYQKFEVAQVTSTSKGGILSANTGYRSFFNPPSYDYANFHNPNGLELINTLNVDRTNQFLFSESFDANTGGGTYELYANGALERSQGSEGTSNLDTPTSVHIGRDPSGGSSGYLVGKIQEIIFFNSDQSGNRTTMETNIDDHFDIYT